MASDLSCVQVPTEESKADFASQQKPWLLVTNGKNYHIQNSMFNNKQLANCYYDVGGEIPEFHGRTIGCFCREWVLLISDGLPVVLVNLLTKETIELPLLDFEYDFCILTSPPSDPTCHVVFFKKYEEQNGEEENGEQENGEEENGEQENGEQDNAEENGEEENGEEENGEEENGEQENGEEENGDQENGEQDNAEENGEENENSLIIWKPGNKEFIIKKWDYEIFPGRVRAVVAGKLFFVHGRDVIMVEFKESTYWFEVLQMDDREIEFMPSYLDHCFEYSGELFAVYKIKCGYYSWKVAGFKIFKADLLNKKWVRIKNLGSLSIFIGHNSAHAHCLAVDSGIAENSIYFLEEDDRDSYYVYNLVEGTLRMKPMFYSMDTTEHTRLDWIMMPCHLSSPKLLKDDQESIRQDSQEENGEIEHDDEVQESWSVVLPELLNLIQLRLFGRDHAVFRGVCKAWQQSSIQDYSLLSSTTFLEQCRSSSPLLMYQEDRTSSIFRFFDPVHRKLYRTRIPELKEADIQYARDGWLLVLRSSDQSLFFFNPLTREKIELPRMPPHLLPPDVSAYIDFLSFSSPPTCSNCLVVGMNFLGSSIYTLKHGEATWKEHELDYIEINGEEDAREYLCNIVVFNGLHYFMCENRDMVIFNLKNGAEAQSPDRQICRSKFRRSPDLRGEDFLVEIDGGPAFVSVSPNGGEISISKWNDIEKDWELMEGGVEFGGKDMFLSKRCSIMEKIDDVGGMGNTIFPPMIDDGKAGVFYSLTTRRYHTFCSGYSSELPYIYSGYSSELPYHVDKFLDGVWVKPDRKIVGQNNLQWFV